jgi:hypothetical protein
MRGSEASAKLPVMGVDEPLVGGPEEGAGVPVRAVDAPNVVSSAIRCLATVQALVCPAASCGYKEIGGFR